MYAFWRGRRLNMEDFVGEYFAEMRFLIGNKRAEDFKLLIEQIELR
jgi:NADH dehydrogenase [ubiquinone] 1 alpha subcomplex assembly factor 1